MAMIDTNKIETQSSISFEWLFQLRLKLDNLIKKIDNQEKKTLLQNSLDLLLLELTPNGDDIFKKGIYKVLILGVSDLSMINDFVGINISGLLSNEDYYLFSINRTFRDRNLVIEFIQDSDISEDSQRIIEGVFRNKNPETNIDFHLKSKKIPSLIIKDFDLSLLQILDDDLKLLKSTNLIKKIKLNINFPIDNTRIVSYFRSIDIIPQCYKFIEEINAIQFQEYFSDSRFYNIIILNAQNDYLIKAFFALLFLYEEKFSLKDEFSNKVLEKIFYVLNHNILNETRLLKENNEYQEKIEGIVFQDDISIRHNHQTIVFFLNYLKYYFLKNFHIKNKNHYISEYLVDNIQNINMANRLINDIKSYIESFPAQYDFFYFMSLKLEEIINKDKKVQMKMIKQIISLDINNNNRKEILTEIENKLFKTLIKSAENFNCLLADELEKVLEKQKQKFQPYFEKRDFLGIQNYKKNDSDFYLLVISTIFAILNTIEKSGIVDTDKIDECSKIEHKLDSNIKQIEDNLNLLNNDSILFELSEILSLEILSIMTNSVST
jgi:hypothetical protein